MPQFPILGPVKAKSELNWLVIAPSVEMKEYAENLARLVAAGEMDNACHDYLRVREDFYHGQTFYESGPGGWMSSRRDEKSEAEQEADALNLKLLIAHFEIEVYRRDWAGAVYSLDMVRIHGSDTGIGRDPSAEARGRCGRFTIR